MDCHETIENNILSSLMASEALRMTLEANNGNLDLTLQIRNFKLLSKFDARAVGHLSGSGKDLSHVE
jgi:hypothetical protein